MTKAICILMTYESDRKPSNYDNQSIKSFSEKKSQTLAAATQYLWVFGCFIRKKKKKSNYNLTMGSVKSN